MVDHYKSLLLMQGVWEITDYSDGINPTVDMYLIEGSSRALLVDAGDSKGDLKGYISRLTDKPVDMCITHGHGDHAAAFSQFENVYLSHKDIHILQTIFEIDIDETMVHDLQDGDVFNLGDTKIEVKALPGHTQGSVVLLDSDRQLLFTGDGLGSGVLWMQFSHCTSIEAYAKELQKLEKHVENMNDLKLFVGHNCQRSLGYGKQYITDMRVLAEKIVSGEIIGKPTKNPDDFFGGLSASYGLISDIIYKPNNIYITSMEYNMKCFQLKEESDLLHLYEQMNAENDCNSSRAVWEWFRNAPCFKMFHTDKIGIWYESNDPVASVRLLSPWMGEVVIDNRSTSINLLMDVVRYAEDTFAGMIDNKRFITIYVNENSDCLKQILLTQYYEPLPTNGDTLQYELENNIPLTTLPEGFEVKPLSEVYDFDKLSKLIWEGFGYDGPVPKIDDEVYLPMKHAWLNYNRNICSVVLAPDGRYASFCGFWYDNNTQTGYLEPMVTAKEYRKLGLGKAGVYNSLRLLQSYGCKRVFVNPDDEPYQYYCKLGFEKTVYTDSYQKMLD